MFRTLGITLGAAIVVTAGCNAIFGVSDLEVGTPPSAGGAGGTSADGGAASGGDERGGGGTSTVGGSGGGGDSDVGGGGGVGGTAVPPLDDSDLLVRYFLDEPENGGMPPDFLKDAGPTPLFDLAMTYDTDVVYVGLPTGRGIMFPSTTHVAVASAQSSNGTKVRTELDGKTAATLEVVFDARPSVDLVAPQFVFMLMQPNSPDGRFGLELTNGFPAFELNQDTPGLADASQQWDVDVITGERHVVHVVVDTTRAAATDRIVMFLDGSLAPIHANPTVPITPPPPDEGVDTCLGCVLALGNSATGNRPFSGTIFYAAIYTVAFSDAQILNNVAALTASDDSSQ